ncbi:fungal-specific transcription factor [Aspergillus pseudonomiae]|uniref:Fungal-specific transcription factor n=1 Tax=Aspergillus pseudonomiae TaxID=1506151 RepID=A0A5N7D265_9EURO|nr:fungal-specific transcription factor [Aspergillus pseudonomiae]KAE8399953.1 fungal-specific transcription factor [Aspergillus pseudonomiae]
MASQKHTYRIASIPGDGIGIEVVDAAIQVVEKLAKTLGTFDIDFTHIPWGTAYYKEHGRYVSEDCLDTLRKFDAGLFGAVGAPDVPDHISLWGLLLALRGPLQLYANVRPVRTFPGTKCPLNTATEGIDWMLVRENSEGEYSGQGGRSHVGQPWEAATEVAMFTRVGIERIMRFAFEVAQSRPRKLLTVVTKSNSMRNGMVLWDQVAAEVAKDFPDVTWDKMLVDAMTVRMVAKPQSIDTIVGTNLHMDILSDLAAALAGSIGVAPSSNLDPTRKNPSIFEPVHGSAFDITGKGVANPVATFWSAAEMLSWLGEKEAAKKLMDCVERVCAAGILTPDLGGTSNTQGVVDAHHVLARMESTDLTSGPSEIGSLTAQSNEESQFVGSSSGVYFINTVRQAFSRNLDTLDASSGQEFPLPEDTLVGIDGSHHDRRSAPSSVKASPMPGGEQPFCQWEYDPAMAAILGQAPPLDTARELMMVYFKVWHPLFPFLHGPTFLQAMELLYSDQRKSHSIPPSPDHRNTCWTVIFQCVFNLASHLRPDLRLPSESRIESPSNMQSLLSSLTFRNDLSSLQALLASQLYLVTKMSLRMASTVGGCMLRSMMHAGLHRCPFRYRELSSHDRQLRKRIFWCAYAIDRYLSQALGLPLGIQDSDIDVCAPGADEIHVPGSHRAHGLRMGLSTFNLDDRASSAPASSADAIQLPAEQSFGHESHRNTPSDSEPLQNKREIAFASYVESGKLTGRALELFHKSILVRSIRRSSVLFLITDVHKWWNSLSVDLQTLRPPTDQDAIADRPFNFGPFFTVLYQHLILLINRPSLSLSPSTPEFCSGLQTCIGAAREILTALKAQVDAKQALFWPGFLSAAWMSGLVLAFACQLRQYVLSKGLQEISKCLDFLQLMSPQWETAKNCHRALTLLSRNIQHSSTVPSLHRPSDPLLSRTRPEDDNDPETRKKRRLHSHPVTRNSRLGSASFATTHNGTEHPSDKDDNTNDPGLGVSNISYSNEIQVSDNPPGLVQGGNRLLLSPTTVQSPEDRLFFPEGGSHSMMDFDLNMVDLLQGANFDNLFDMFGQQYPSF